MNAIRVVPTPTCITISNGCSTPHVSCSIYRFAMSFVLVYTLYITPNMLNAPRPAEIDPRELTSFSDAGRFAEQFEEVLRGSYGIAIKKGSDLEAVSLDLMFLEDFRLGKGRPDPTTDVRPILGRAAGWLEFVQLLLRAHQEKKLAVFVPHLQLLNEAKVVAQNRRSQISHEADNKLFEMFIALCCTPFCDEVTLDHPHNAKGNNPDVLAVSGGTKWGFACKVLNGASPITMFERLEEGIKQIEVSPADTGFVFFNFKNILDHRRAWPIVNEDACLRAADTPTYGSWPDRRIVLSQLEECVNARWKDCIDFNGPKNVLDLFAGKKTMAGAAVYMATSTSITTSTGPLATMLGQVAIMRSSEVDPKGEAMLARINDVLKRRC